MGSQITTDEAVERFIVRWQGREGGQERANYVSFLNELITLLGLPPPDPADATHENNDYVFERAVKKHKDEGDSHGRIDLYKKNSFVLEAKQSRVKGGKKEIKGQNDLFAADIAEDSRGRRGADRAWDVLMLNAQRQAEEYAYLAWLAAVYPRLRCRALHRGLRRLLRARKELYSVPGPPDLSYLS